MNDKRAEGNRPQGQSASQVWTPVHDVTDPTTGLTIRISRTSAERPWYSFQIGNLNLKDATDKRLRPFTRMSVVYMTTAKVAESKVPVLTRLMQEAENWAEDDAQEALVMSRKANDERKLDAQIAREKAQLERQKPKQPAELKTLAKHDAAKWAAVQGSQKATE